MTTPGEPTTPGWTAPSSGTPSRPDDAATPGATGPDQPAAGATGPGGTGGTGPSLTKPGQPAAGGPSAGQPTTPPTTGPAGPAPTPPGGWGPGYTSPTAGPPGYGPGWAPEHPLPGQGPGPTSGPGPVPPWPQAGRYAPSGGYGPLAPRPGIVPLRPLGLGEILDGAFRAIRANPRVMFGLSAVVVAVTVAIQTVLQWYVGGLLAGEIADASDTLDPAGELGLAETFAPTLATAATSPLISVAITVLTGLLIVSVSRSVIGQRIGVGEVWSRSWRRVLLLLVFSFVSTALILAVWGAFVGVLVLLGTAEQWGVLVALALLGGLALLAATVWFSIRILLIPATLVLEGTGVGTAIKRGWRLTRGSFWRLLGIYLLTSIMVAVVAGLIATPASLVSAFLLQDPLLTSFGSIVIIGIANVVAYTLTTSFMAAVLALLYIDVRMRREGLDVELARAAAEAA
jgi:hypothetical protein